MAGGSLADVGQQSHEPRPLDGIARRPLERGAVAAALARKHLALISAELLQEADVLVIDVGRAGASLGGAEAATVLAVAAKAFARHELRCPRTIASAMFGGGR